MTVIRRLDIVLEPTKEKVLQTKKMLAANKVVNLTEALCMAAGHPFCNSSPFCLKDLTSLAKKQTLKADFIAYLDGFSPNVQEILDSMTLYELRFKDCRGGCDSPNDRVSD